MNYYRMCERDEYRIEIYSHIFEYVSIFLFLYRLDVLEQLNGNKIILIRCSRTGTTSNILLMGKRVRYFHEISEDMLFTRVNLHMARIQYRVAENNGKGPKIVLKTE